MASRSPLKIFDPQSDRPVDPFSALGLIRTADGYVRQVGESLLVALRRWQVDDASGMAATVAYYLALSLFPMLLLLIAGVGLVMQFTQLGQDAEAQILSVVAEHCSSSLEAQVREVLAQLRVNSVVSGPFGLLTATLAAISVFHQFERAFDKIWRVVPPKKTDWKMTMKRLLLQRCAAFMLFIGVGLAIVGTLAANVAIGYVRQWMTHLHLPGTVAITIVDATATIFLNAVAFGALYRWLPKSKVLWKDAFRGGLLVSIIWEVGRQFLSAFLIGMRYSSAYGAIGSFIALLLWFYWGVTILLFGAEYVKVLSRYRQRPLKMFRPNSTDTVTPPTEVRGLEVRPSESRIVPRRKVA